jgi:hypothetical protein
VEKHARRTGTPLTMDEFKAKANLEVVGNDLVWEDPAKVLRNKDLERLASKIFWTSLKMKDDFKVVLRAVLPNLWEDSFLDQTKTLLISKIGPYLAKVSKIADRKIDNDILPEVDITGMTRIDILAVFVKQDATTCLADARAHSKKTHMLTAALISSGGTEINQRYLPTSERVDADAENDDDDAGFDYDGFCASDSDDDDLD